MEVVQFPNKSAGCRINSVKLKGLAVRDAEVAASVLAFAYKLHRISVRMVLCGQLHVADDISDEVAGLNNLAKCILRGDTSPVEHKK